MGKVSQLKNKLCCKWFDHPADIKKSPAMQGFKNFVESTGELSNQLKEFINRIYDVKQIVERFQDKKIT